jgi:hypothetical protein
MKASEEWIMMGRALFQKAWKFGLLGIFMAAVFGSCSGEPEDRGEVLARINDYTLTLEEFETQLAADLEMDEQFKLTQQAKQEFLERLVRKEILIQEAKRRNLDQREEFIRAIERYWESTLIRDLMAMKGDEVVKRSSITEEQIQESYQALKEKNEDLPPFDEMRERIGRMLLEEIRQERLKAWVEELREEAKVEVDEALLKGRE